MSAARDLAKLICQNSVDDVSRLVALGWLRGYWCRRGASPSLASTTSPTATGGHSYVSAKTGSRCMTNMTGWTLRRGASQA
jgi:hypothetical protein